MPSQRLVFVGVADDLSAVVHAARVAVGAPEGAEVLRCVGVAAPKGRVDRAVRRAAEAGDLPVAINCKGRGHRPAKWLQGEKAGRLAPVEAGQLRRIVSDNLIVVVDRAAGGISRAIEAPDILGAAARRPKERIEAAARGRAGAGDVAEVIDAVADGVEAAGKGRQEEEDGVSRVPKEGVHGVSIELAGELVGVVDPKREIKVVAGTVGQWRPSIRRLEKGWDVVPRHNAGSGAGDGALLIDAGGLIGRLAGKKDADIDHATGPRPSKGMGPIAEIGVTDDFAEVVDAGGVAILASEGAEVFHPMNTVPDESMLFCTSEWSHGQREASEENRQTDRFFHV